MTRILIGALIIGLIAGGTWFIGQQRMRNWTMGSEPTPSKSMQTAIDTTSFATTTSIIDLLSLGEPITCTYTQTEESVTGEGTIYLDGLSRFRVMGTQTRSDGTYDNNIIYTKTEMAMWVTSKDRTMAFAIPVVKPITELKKENTVPIDTQIVYDTVSYTCTTWNVDDSVFERPTDIEFIDIGAFMEKVLQEVPMTTS